MRKVILRSANHVLWAVQRLLPGNPVLDQHRQIRRINQNRSDYATQVKFPSVVRKTEAQGVLLPEHAQMAMSSILVLLLSGPHRCRITIFMQLAQSQKILLCFQRLTVLVVLQTYRKADCHEQHQNKDCLKLFKFSAPSNHNAYWPHFIFSQNTITYEDVG